MTRYRGRLTRGEVAAANKEIIRRAQERARVQVIKVDLPEKPAYRKDAAAHLQHCPAAQKDDSTV